MEIGRSAYNCCRAIDPNNSAVGVGVGPHSFSSSPLGAGPYRFHGHTALTELPSPNLRRNLWYDDCDLIAAWDETVRAAAAAIGLQQQGSNSSEEQLDPRCFAADAIDVTRQESNYKENECSACSNSNPFPSRR